jgi:hypothetical protein
MASMGILGMALSSFLHPSLSARRKQPDLKLMRPPGLQEMLVTLGEITLCYMGSLCFSSGAMPPRWAFQPGNNHNWT